MPSIHESRILRQTRLSPRLLMLHFYYSLNDGNKFQKSGTSYETYNLETNYIVCATNQQTDLTKFTAFFEENPMHFQIAGRFYFLKRTLLTKLVCLLL